MYSLDLKFFISKKWEPLYKRIKELISFNKRSINKYLVLFEESKFYKHLARIRYLLFKNQLAQQCLDSLQAFKKAIEKLKNRWNKVSIRDIPRNIWLENEWHLTRLKEAEKGFLRRIYKQHNLWASEKTILLIDEYIEHIQSMIEIYY